MTDKRDQEKALYESEQRFRMLVQGVRDYAIYMLDKDGRVTNWNAGAEAIKGYSADEIIGQHFSKFYTEEDRARQEPAHALGTALREGKYEREAWRVRKDGTLFWASVLLDPIFDDSGNHIGFAKVTRDITEKKNAQDALDKTREELAQSQKLQALGQLTGGVAHDFNNHLTVIAGAADFLFQHEELPRDKRQAYLRAIIEACERATTLTGQLLTFARRQSLKPEVLDLNVRLDAFGEIMARMLGSSIKVELCLEAECPVVLVDVTQLETALLNAAINARDAMPNGGQLTIGTSSCKLDEQEAVCITIRDTGIGISKDALSRVFEPFFTTKEIGKGTGLGLSQIHGFAAQAGGIVDLESEIGVGTCVRITLPRSDEALSVGVAREEMNELPAGLRVLLVEDNPQVREFAAGLLGELGCVIASAGDGSGALKLLENSDFDLVFSDVVMPRMSGVELAQMIMELRPGLPILLATGYSHELADRPCEFPVVAKPYNGSALVHAIAQAIETHRQRVA